MKKLLQFACGTIVFFLLVSVNVYSQSSTGNTATTGIQQGRNFVDGNNDGICDHFADRPARQGRNFIDENNDGICDNRTAAKGVRGRGGRNYVDANNDGICDNRQNAGNCKRNGAGRNAGCGRYGYRGGRK